MASPDTLSECLSILSNHWPNETWDKAGIRAKSYLSVLSDIDDELLRGATLKVLSEHPYPTMPKAAVIREAAFSIKDIANGVPAAGDAWDEVVSEIRRIGMWGAPKFSHPIIDRTVRALGGWHTLCLSENIVADRARFLDIYDDYRRRRHDEAVLLPQIKALAEKLALPAPGGSR